MNTDKAIKILMEIPNWNDKVKKSKNTAKVLKYRLSKGEVSEDKKKELLISSKLFKFSPESWELK